MDINVNSRAIEKLVDYVASGIGSTAGHLFAGRIAHREVERRVIAAKGDVQVQRILTEGQADTMQIISTAQADARAALVSPNAIVRGEVAFGDLVTQRIQFQEQKRQANIGSVVGQAASELGDKEIQDREIDHDWTARFFSEVQDVSSEEMQQLWAKVLAGEVERAGSTSIKTLGVLKSLNKSTAALFGTLCSIHVSTRFNENHFIDARVPSLGGNAGDNALREYGLGFGDLNVLNEHGLIIPDYNSWFDYNMSIENWTAGVPTDTIIIPFCFQGKFWVLTPKVKRSPEQEFRLSGISLTRSGQELSRVIELQQAEESCVLPKRKGRSA